MRVLAVSGSLRPESHNSQLLRAARELAPDLVEWDVYDALITIPPFHGERDDPDAPESVQHWRDRIAAADAVLFATPEYNGSVPGVLKNAVDWASTPFPDNVLHGKPVMVIGASTGSYGAMWAQADLRRILGITGARVLDGDLAVARAHEAFDEDGRLRSAPQTERLAGLLGALAAESLPAAA
jgi:chromate reductase, NAD(P)H dehydrogenase (quinone)